jgi:predicted dehydrogenase
MRFGLVGTGPWAVMAHGPGLVSLDEVELVGVWGRHLDRAQPVAQELGARAYEDYAALLRDVEAVAFTVPPDVQAVMATEAAKAGKHLLLEKPVATTVPAAQALADAARDVASVVFFTDRFASTARSWFEDVHGTGGWLGGWMRWFSALQAPGNPFGASPWRHELGALWDTGPHALSTLSAALGPVARVTATAGAADLVHLVLHHESGTTSTVTLTQFAPPAVETYEVTLWGEPGFSTMPQREGDPHEKLAVAARELMESAASGRPHECDVRFGARVVELIAEAQAQLA